MSQHLLSEGRPPLSQSQGYQWSQSSQSEPEPPLLLSQTESQSQSQEAVSVVPSRVNNFQPQPYGRVPAQAASVVQMEFITSLEQVQVGS